MLYIECKASVKTMSTLYKYTVKVIYFPIIFTTNISRTEFTFVNGNKKGIIISFWTIYTYVHVWDKKKHYTLHYRNKIENDRKLSIWKI